MSPSSYLIQRVMKLPPPTTRRLVVQRDLRIPMPDGVELLADRWMPRAGGETLPVALIRTPYGRSGFFGVVAARPLAERGYQVLIQSVRGSFGSGGTFNPMSQERADGLATLDWLVRQPWCGDAIVLVGLSYLGYAQWAVADQLPPQVKAMIPQVTESALSLEFLRKDGFSLEAPFGWGVMLNTQERRGAFLRAPVQARKNLRAMATLPLNRADVVAMGQQSEYIQNVLTHDAEDPYWTNADHRDRVARVTVPVSSVGGWFDVFLPGQLRDFVALQEAGCPARLTIGPWTHIEPTNAATIEAIEFGLAHARGEQPPERAPVRLYMMGEEAWRDFDSWPPEGYPQQPHYLQAGGELSTAEPAESEPDKYRYDPADPTPAVGGVRMEKGGRVNNDRLEARADVLTYTSAVLDHDVEVVGEVSAEIWFRSSLPCADVFVRLCDVDPRGQSTNICDGLTSVTDAAQTTRAEVRLWPTAYRFMRGHRIRVQVSSGAFPRYARNPGTGEPHATATELRAADQAVYHDPSHPSSILLPVRQAE